MNIKNSNLTTSMKNCFEIVNFPQRSYEYLCWWNLKKLKFTTLYWPSAILQKKKNEQKLIDCVDYKGFQMHIKIFCAV